MGGGSRIDAPYNILPLCRECHNLAHVGKIDPADLLEIIAKREKMTPQQIREKIWQTLGAPKGG